MPRPRLILASTSKYRSELLARLRIPFQTIAPQTDETALPGEPPDGLALRLAQAKARAVASKHAGTLVIGSDQVLAFGSELLGKPGSHQLAVEQLRLLSGQRMVFHTAVAMVEADSGRHASRIARIAVRFRKLDDSKIERYLQLEKPYDCAGSAKSEGLGIALLESVESSDPTALVGLPLISVVELLAHFGHQVFDLIEPGT